MEVVQHVPLKLIQPEELESVLAVPTVQLVLLLLEFVQVAMLVSD